MTRLRFHLLPFATSLVSPACLLAAEPVLPPALDAIPRLPVTTGWLGNSLLRGGQADWSDKRQTYLQLYTSDMVVTGDGRIYCTTTSEEGARAAGIYKDGDALEDIPGFGLDSGSSVAVEDALAPSGGKASFEAKDDAGFVGLEFEKLSAVHSVRFSGAGFTTFIGAKLQGSTAGPTGPWTDILKIEYEPRGWPETVIPLDGTARRSGVRSGTRTRSRCAREPERVQYRRQRHEPEPFGKLRSGRETQLADGRHGFPR